MKAVLSDGPESLRRVEIDRRELPAVEVRIKVEAAGVCGTDVRIFKGKYRAFPSWVVKVPGHEIVGSISETAPDAQYENSVCLNGAVLRVHDGCDFVERLPSHHVIIAMGDLRRTLPGYVRPRSQHGEGIDDPDR